MKNSPKSYQVLAFYRFVTLSRDEIDRLRQAFEGFALRHGLLGLVVLGDEGINATVAATPEVSTLFKALLHEMVGDLEFKVSASERRPFRRFKVDVRPEVVTFKQGDVVVTGEGKLAPEKWQEEMNSAEAPVMIDVRNSYETALGMFDGALDPGLKKFSEFSGYLEKSNLPKDQKYLLYCTGGIRCEKAVEDMRERGYNKVYQLDGGILRYLERFPDSKFNGECFVFDHRVAVDQHLQPSARYSLCPHCGNPGDLKIVCPECGKDAVVCCGCAEKPERKSCSKNCRYHLLRKGSCSAQAL